MANTTNNDWDETAPAATDSRKYGDDEIRLLRGSVRTRLEKEHVTPAGSGAGGEHKAGSAKIYVTNPSGLRPDGTTSLTSADNGRLWYDGTTLYVYAHPNWSAISVVGAMAVLHDLKAANTGGGSFTSGSWVKRTLTELSDPQSIITVSSSVISITNTGTYHVWARCPAFRVNTHQAKLRKTNATASTLLVGSQEYSAQGSNYGSSNSIIEGIVSATAGDTWELQHRCETTSAGTDGLGKAANFGESNVHATMRILKIG